MDLRRADSTLGAWDVGDSDAVASSPRLTGCPPGFRAQIEAILTGMVIPDVGYRERWYLVVTASYGQLVDGQTYSVSPRGHLRIRAADGSVALFRRWRALCSLSNGILRGLDSPEARVVAVKPSMARPRRYRVEAPITPAANRTLRAQLVELKQRQEAGTA